MVSERPRNAIRNYDVKFAFECPMNWKDLDRTGENRVRHCRVCAQRVFLCRTVSEALGMQRLAIVWRYQGKMVARLALQCYWVGRRR